MPGVSLAASLELKHPEADLLLWQVVPGTIAPIAFTFVAAAATGPTFLGGKRLDVDPCGRADTFAIQKLDPGILEPVYFLAVSAAASAVLGVSIER
jgi:hypothetical protein